GLVDLTCTGLPAGASCPNPFVSGPQAGGFELPFAITTQTVATGNYPFTITGVSSPLTHSVSATLQVWDFNPSVAPASGTVQAGESANFTVTVASANGFDGSVNFWCEALSKISCVFNPTSANVPASGTLTSTLTLTARSQQGSLDQDRSYLTLAFTVLGLPIGALFITAKRSRRKW